MTDGSLEKALWTDRDFETMGWHDATVHAVAFRSSDKSSELLLDIDYIVRWIHPEPPDRYFTFLVAPATLVFRDVWNLRGEIETTALPLEVQDIHRLDHEDDRQREVGVQPWTIEGHDFEMTLISSGFHQHFRARPTATPSQRLSPAERGEISFEQPLEFPDPGAP